MCRLPTRRAYGLIELLIVLALAVLLIGFLFAAEVRVRENAQRMTTIDNLKQCTLAVHNFHDIYRRMPDAYAPGGAYPNADKTFWFHLLQFMDQENVYKADSADTAVVDGYGSPDDPYNTDRKG